MELSISFWQIILLIYIPGFIICFLHMLIFFRNENKNVSSHQSEYEKVKLPAALFISILLSIFWPIVSVAIIMKIALRPLVNPIKKFRNWVEARDC